MTQPVAASPAAAESESVKLEQSEPASGDQTKASDDPTSKLELVRPSVLRGLRLPTFGPRLRFFDFSKAGDQPKPRFVIKDVLPDGICIMYGETGTYKSFIAIDIALTIALGKSWHGLATLPGPVVYVAAEGAAGVAQRAEAWQKRFGHAPARRSICITEAIRLDLLTNNAYADEFVDQILKALGGELPVLIVIDTLHANSAGLEENSAKEMGVVIDACRRLRAKLGSAVLLVHHSGKDLSKGMRGNSSLRSDADGVLEVTASKLHATIDVEKSKDGAKRAPIGLVLEPYDDTLVVSDLPVATASKRPSLAPGARDALAVLAELKRARNKDWVAAAKAKHGGGDSTWQRHIAELRRRELVTSVGDLYSLTSTGREVVGLEAQPQDGQSQAADSHETLEDFSRD